MDLDSIITFVFLLIFFILPSILKVLARKKKTPVTESAPKKKPSVFGKIGEQIQKFIQDLEEQARQQQKAQKEQEDPNLWATLSEEGTTEDEEWAYLQSEEENIQTPPLPPSIDSEYPQRLIVDEDLPDIENATLPLEEGIHQKPTVTVQTRFRSHPLQNAVVWSEILSKPVALREK